MKKCNGNYKEAQKTHGTSIYAHIRAYQGLVSANGTEKKDNEECPEDFTGASMSVSDVVVLRQKGENHSFYVDRIGFTELPGFLAKQQEKENSRARGKQTASAEKRSIRTKLAAHKSEQSKTAAEAGRGKTRSVLSVTER